MLKPGADIPHVGRFAVVADPFGASNTTSATFTTVNVGAHVGSEVPGVSCFSATSDVAGKGFETTPWCTIETGVARA